MSTLNNEQRLSLTEQLAEVLSYADQDSNYPEDVAHEVADSWLPIYYNGIVEEWHAAGGPPVEDTGLIAESHVADVYHIMQAALYEQALAWVSHLFWNYSEEDVKTAGEALTACNTYLAVRGVNTYAPNGVKQGRVMSW